MNVVQLPDIHLTAPGTLVEGLDTHARLAPALEHMQRHVPDIARLVITGTCRTGARGRPMTRGAFCV